MGKSINTGAIAGKIGGPNMALYSAVKDGVIGCTVLYLASDERAS